MNFSLVYLLHRGIYRFGDFFRHWYIDGSRWFIHGFVSFLERLDRGFALRVTIKHFFEPLYKDYSVVGRILGVVFRAGRIVVAGFFYVFSLCVFMAVYFFWLTLPIGIVIYAIVKLKN